MLRYAVCNKNYINECYKTIQKRIELHEKTYR